MKSNKDIALNYASQVRILAEGIRKAIAEDLVGLNRRRLLYEITFMEDVLGELRRYIEKGEIE